MTADILVGKLPNNDDSISLKFNTQVIASSNGGMQFTNSKVPTSGVPSDTILSFRNPNGSGFQFIHSTSDTPGDLGTFKIQSSINNVSTDILNFSSNTITLSGAVVGSGSGNIVTTFVQNPIFLGTQSMTIPVGNTSQRPVSPQIGMIRYNTDL